VVLVNKGSASASEILSGALHDNKRAMIIGDTPTYGEGWSKECFEVSEKISILWGSSTHSSGWCYVVCCVTFMTTTAP
jgi:hypothetical protein